MRIIVRVAKREAHNERQQAMKQKEIFENKIAHENKLRRKKNTQR